MQRTKILNDDYEWQKMHENHKKYLIITLRGNELDVMIIMLDDYVHHIKNTTNNW